MNVEDEIGVEKKYRGLMRVVKNQRRAGIMLSKKFQAFLRVANERCCKRSGIEDICRIKNILRSDLISQFCMNFRG